MLFLPPFLVILFYNINIIGPKNRWTNRIFSKIKQILGKKNLNCFEGQRDFEIFSFILFFFFKRYNQRRKFHLNFRLLFETESFSNQRRKIIPSLIRDGNSTPD